jgi:hypothetical protein
MRVRVVAHGYVVKIKNPRAPDLIESWYAYISDPAEAVRAVMEAAHSAPDETVYIDDELTLERLMNHGMEPGQVRRAV